MRDFNDKSKLIQIGNREDFCYLCLKEIKEDNEEKYYRSIYKLKNSSLLEGKKVMKLNRHGTQTVICLEHIHKIAKENPIESKK